MQENLSEKSIILKRIKEKRIGKNVPNEKPKVSVVIPAYNVSKSISETLESVLAQLFTDYEIIVVNDGSKDSDELEKVLEKYFHKIIYAKQENFGASRARNLAITISRGDIIAFLDGDDIWNDNYLSSQLTYLGQNNLDMLYCDAELFGDSYFLDNTYMKTSPSVGVVNSISLINGTCSVLTSGTVLRKEQLEEFGMFDTDINGYEDFDLWFRLAKNGAKIAYQQEILLKYRISATSLSGSTLQRAKRGIKVLELIDKKYDFTPNERSNWKKHMSISLSELELEKSKICLIEKKYAEAEKHIVKANDYCRKPKLTVLKWLLKISPTLTLKLFKKLRPAEFSFIAPKQKQN